MAESGVVVIRYEALTPDKVLEVFDGGVAMFIEGNQAWKLVTSILIYLCFVLGLVLEWNWRHSVLGTLPIIWLLYFAKAQGVRPVKVRFEVVVLSPLALTLDALAIAHFFQRAWWSGLLLLILGFVVGSIGQSLHPELSAAELAAGVQFPERSSPGRGRLAALTSDEGHAIGKLIVLTFPVFLVGAVVVLRDSGFMFLWTVVISVAAAAVLCFYSAFAVAYRTDD